MGAKPSHGPLIAILATTALIVTAACGGAVYLLARGVSSVRRVAEVRRGPAEVIDTDYRIRVVRPTDGEWELWDRELAPSWYPEAILVLRDSTCSAGVAVTPSSRTRSLDEQTHASFPELTSRPVASPRGGRGEARALGPDVEGETSFVFTHGDVLYRVLGHAPCTSRLYESLEILDGPVVARWTMPTIENATGRSYRVVDRVFESAATGLHVDATEPFSLVLEDLARTYGSVEVVVRHRNGTEVSLDAFVGAGPLAAEPDEGSFVHRVLDTDVRFSQPEPGVMAWFGVATRGAMGVGVAAAGPDRESVIEAVGALALRVDVLDGARLEQLRASMPPPSDRRAGVDWSLRDGVFRELPSEPRPRVELVVPEWTDVLAGSELSDADLAAGVVLLLDRRDLGVSARLRVRPATSDDARDELATELDFDDGEIELGPIEGDASRASAELIRRAEHETAMHVDVWTRDQVTFVLELSWRRHRDELAFDYARSVGELFALEAPSASEGSRYRDERFGLVFDPGTRPLRERPTESSGVEAITFVSTLTDLNEGVMLLAASDPRPSVARAILLAHLGLNRSPAVLASLPGEDTTLDGHPATVRTIVDVGFETRLVEARLDRTTYLVVIRTLAGGDWQSELARVDLGP